MKLRSVQIGDQASGIVVDVTDWGGHNPRIIRPRRTAAGIVHRIFTAAPNIVGVTTPAGDDVCIRRDLF